MKAVVISSETIDLSGIKYPKIQLIVDSAIGRDVMPVFIPDIPVEWQMKVCVALRIERLGKNISEKFAMRYVDAVGLVGLLTPSETQAEGRELIASGAFSIMDSALTTGQWLSIEILDSEYLHFNIGESEYQYSIQELRIPQCINLITRLSTIKTGDIIVLQSTAVDVPSHINSRTECKIEGTTCLTLRIK